MKVCLTTSSANYDIDASLPVNGMDGERFTERGKQKKALRRHIFPLLLNSIYVSD